jgi:hypothetical protein
MDDVEISSAPEVWEKRSSIVRMFTSFQVKAHNKGFALHLLTDSHGTHLLQSSRGHRGKIPDWFVLDPDSWPAQGYLSRFLNARVVAVGDVSSGAVDNCVTLRNQLELISALDGWPQMAISGMPVRAFTEATMHIVQMQFFGVPAENVRADRMRHACCRMYVVLLMSLRLHSEEDA